MKDIIINVLTSPGCSHCDDFLLYWNSIRGEWPSATMKEISILSTEGQQLALRYMIFASPGIILNNEVFSTGGYDKKKFIQKLEALS